MLVVRVSLFPQFPCRSFLLFGRIFLSFGIAVKRPRPEEAHHHLAERLPLLREPPVWCRYHQHSEQTSTLTYNNFGVLVSRILTGCCSGLMRDAVSHFLGALA